MADNQTTLASIISLCKRRGFVFQTASIYGGLNGVYDFGPRGVAMKEEIIALWKKAIDNGEQTIVPFDGSILTPLDVWKASGHIDHFSDPMVDCTHCKRRYRSDEIDITKACPFCGKKAWTEERAFNMMFQTKIGAEQSSAACAYLRPETAQSIFINFKQIMTTARVKIPFGVMQCGKAFRNEITPKQFLFRIREFEQMELEWFCHQDEAENYFDFWTKQRKQFYSRIGIDENNIRIRAHKSDELAHYSKMCNDLEYRFPFGWKELEGIAHRGTFDLERHTAFSKKELSVHDQEAKAPYLPTVIECSVGVDRLFLALLFQAYTQDTLAGEARTVLNLSPLIAPVKAAFLPLTKKLHAEAFSLFSHIRKRYRIEYDQSGSIGKRYRRYDEIGTPFCFTYDFESSQDKKITVRDRTTGKQMRIDIAQIEAYLDEKIFFF